MKDYKKTLKQHRMQILFSPFALVIGLYFIVVEQSIQTGRILLVAFVILAGSQSYAYYTVRRSLVAVKKTFKESPESIQRFFKRTYDVWHGGDLDYFDPSIKTYANVDFDNFLLNLYPRQHNNDSLDIFVRDCHPSDDEFYMGSGNDPQDKEMPAWFLLTNKRYFIRDGITNEMIEITLDEIDNMHLTKNFPATLSVTMHSGVTLMIQHVKRALNPPDLLAIRDAMRTNENHENKKTAPL